MNMTRATRIKRQSPRVKVLIGVIVLYVLSQTGCAPTYPKEMLDQAVVQLCREEYGLDVKVKIINSTIGVYIPIEGLFGPTLTITKEAAEKINDVILSTSRVTLSTDAPLKFYIVVAQDPMLPEIEVVLIRYVNDIKMLHFDRISRGEFTKRMIVNIKLTPQAQREKALRSVFGRLNITSQDVDDLIREYLNTSEVSNIGDVGYWQDTFYIKDIYMGEFLALQIADRVKAKFAIDASLKERFKLSLIKGEFLEEGGKLFFRFTFDSAPIETASLLGPDEELDTIYSNILDVITTVIHGYKFEDFWNIEIENAGDNQVLFATRDELESFRNRKMKQEEFRRWYK